MPFRSNQLLFIALIFLIFSSATQAKILKISTITPDGSIWMQEFRKSAKEIAKRTDNRVKFKFYPGEVMGDSKTILRKIRLGQLQGATFTNASLSKIYPDIQLYNLILKFQSTQEVDYVRQRMDAVLLNGLGKNGLEPLGFAEISFAYMMSTYPMSSINDMKNLKAWVPEDNSVAQITLEAFPVARIPLPTRDVLVALQTGMIDIVPGSPIAALALQWHTKLKYLTDLPLSYVFGVMALDKKAFDKISPEDRQIVKELMGRAMKNIGENNRKDNANAISALKNQGIKFIKPNEEEVAEIKQRIKSANEQLISTGKLSPELVRNLDQYLAEYRAQNSIAH